ncbi:helix-turn-helix transcriptional regulator [Bacillus pumilus]|uniref:Transcriptional regulator n=1 Tax=Bacillus pumilus TaxID=1408 RepID=A0A2G8IY21_BACPU|nr:helix-turn-helix transcriptional regulator [Bacillus pumilus]PIK28402.1 transcriptional regulator [Bacillus pumilus]
MAKQKVSMLLKEARKRKKLTHQNVVDLLKIPITRQYYGAIERGERTPTVNVAKQIATILGVDWVIFFDEDVN